MRLRRALRLRRRRVGLRAAARPAFSASARPARSEATRHRVSRLSRSASHAERPVPFLITVAAVAETGCDQHAQDPEKQPEEDPADDVTALPLEQRHATDRATQTIGQQDINLRPGNQGVNIIAGLKLILEDEGVYWIDVVLSVPEVEGGDQLLTRVPLEVVYQRQHVPADASPPT